MIRSRMLLANVMSLSLIALLLLGITPNLRAADAAADLPAKTALDDYIAKPDSTYAWKVVKTEKKDGVTGYVIELTAQTWRTPEEVDRPVWKHWLVIVKPDKVKFDTAFMIVSGGSYTSGMPNPASGMGATIATTTQSVVAEIKQIPNQPLVFFNDGKKRVEDDIIAYTWDKYMKTGDPTWLARFPMVKSVVRAMDTVQTFLASEEGGKVKIDKFVVAGASKRGWTTWLTGATDKRVVAIIPIVIDVLNCVKSLAHHYACYGFWAPAIKNYKDHKIVDRLDAPELAELFKYVDPYSYRHRLTMPKYIVTGSGDQFFLPDSSRFYFDDLQGEKYLGTVPNRDHDALTPETLMSIVAFYKSILEGTPRPQFSWKFESDGEVHIDCKDQPVTATLWQANNPDGRDFRLEKIGPQYKATTLKGTSGQYVAKVEKPEKGWTAWFVELTYVQGGLPLKLTTPVRVIPDTRPFADQTIPGTHMKAGQ